MDYFMHTITKLNKGISTDRILKHILQFDSEKVGTYVILGKPGPTGKTWLQKKLEDLGYNAIEISEAMALSDAIEYKDGNNHVIELPSGTTVIILNKWIL